MKSNNTRKKEPSKGGGEVLTTRITEDLMALRIGERVRTLARTSGLSEGAILRSLIMLGLRQAETDLAAIVKAPTICREGLAAAAA